MRGRKGQAVKNRQIGIIGIVEAERRRKIDGETEGGSGGNWRHNRERESGEGGEVIAMERERRVRHGEIERVRGGDKRKRDREKKVRGRKVQAVKNRQTERIRKVEEEKKRREGRQKEGVGETGDIKRERNERRKVQAEKNRQIERIRKVEEEKERQKWR